jgi:hypothetical protein
MSRSSCEPLDFATADSFAPMINDNPNTIFTGVCGYYYCCDERSILTTAHSCIDAFFILHMPIEVFDSYKGFLACPHSLHLIAFSLSLGLRRTNICFQHILLVSRAHRDDNFISSSLSHTSTFTVL